ncbi:unnamed protein product [Didymodactylos carnosus]|uniref:Uncharacterized protein n=1 Tax=Didymodactylos carnosus TaxID=1234261 RepID=A0A814K592_9BILA|nr:unnamed protein product [Didymodactylos carnosus]CAF1046409.1 unnamed protein product [Didymodactylos carnosus]CAF3602188.1 unnamed protein product [Didymodactylos carnosus]CAF3816247.1 unnamed protein product [Didymodactylos carnosus]
MHTAPTTRSDSYSESVQRGWQQRPLSNDSYSRSPKQDRNNATRVPLNYKNIPEDKETQDPALYPFRRRQQQTDNLVKNFASASSFFNVPSKPREVSLRVKFIRLGEVNTLQEKFYAEVVIEARWLYDGQDQLTSAWNPNLFVKNALGDVKQEVASELVTTNPGESYMDTLLVPTSTNDSHMLQQQQQQQGTYYVCEIRKVVGTFWEKLELNNFPADIQQLSLQIVTRRPIEECVLVENRLQPSLVNREAFLATCCVSRRPGYFYWNVYLLIFLITLIALTVYAVAPELPQNRLQITATLLLTSIMFRWSVSRLLPPVSYLTLLDKYTLISLVFISLNSIWHSIVGYLIPKIGLSKSIDYYVLLMFCALFIIYHILMGLLLYFAFRRRQIMLESDKKYASKLASMYETFEQGHLHVQRFKERSSSSRSNLFV